MKNLKEMNDTSTQQRVNTRQVWKKQRGQFGGYEIKYVAVANGDFNLGINYHRCRLLGFVLKRSVNKLK